ncbi:MAG: amino acid ABC transporter permease [Actinobacteria bacterium]|nr:amino acid ABC transporter permease [Actinomycetota bacterium]
MSSVLTEDLGPRGQQRVRIAQWISLVVIIAIIAFAIFRMAATGNFAPRLYEQFIDFDERWPQYVIAGLGNTIKAALVAMVFATAIGFILALSRIAQNPISRALARVYIDVFRSIPLLLLILFGFFGIQQFVNISQLTGLVIGLVLYNSAVLAEIFRAGILSLSKGQSEAASSLGMTYWQSMQLVILPQAVRRMIPAIVAQLATLTKDTSLGFVIGYEEALRRARQLGEQSPSNVLQAFIFAGILYFIVIFALARIARRLEVRTRKRFGAQKMEGGAGLEDIEALGEEADEDEMAEREPAPATSA